MTPHREAACSDAASRTARKRSWAITPAGAATGRRRRTAVLVAALAAALIGCGGSHKNDSPRTSSTPENGRAPTPVGGQRVADIPRLVREVSPSVVAISVETPNGRGTGSGVAWDRAGDVVTNNHVVEGASAVEVHDDQGRRFRARVVATDPRTDLAVVKLVRADVPPAVFAKHLPEVGALALAMGSPLGFENTVTAGIVSGLDRSLPTDGTEPSLVGLLQTDAAISPGNSGGALVGPAGEVIGINVAYLPPQQTGAVSIGFAIPAPIVRDVVAQLIKSGRVEHAYLGVQLAPAAGDTQTGVIVASVERGGPADHAGVQPSDILSRVDGRKVTSIEDVYDALRGHRPGETIPVVVRRGSADRDLDVKLGTLPAPATGVLPGGGG